MRPGDRLVCMLIKPLERGARFKAWPLHITIIPWFRVPENNAELLADLRRRLEPFQPFEATVNGEARFGKGRLVNLIAQPSPLTSVARQVRVYLHLRGAWIVDETTKVRRPFRPHVTIQGDTRLQRGDRIYCDQLTVVEQYGDYKEVIGNVRLGA